jgi:hypothetical protein
VGSDSLRGHPQGRWKLIEYYGDRYDSLGAYRPGRHVELFNLRSDPGETTDLAPREADRRESLVAELHRLIKDCGAEIPATNPHHESSRAFLETSTKPEFLK